MVFCDRHYGGINYPVVSPSPPPIERSGCRPVWAHAWPCPTVLPEPLTACLCSACSAAHLCRRCPCAQGGVGTIPQQMAEGLREHGGYIEYKANAQEILVEGEGEDARVRRGVCVGGWTRTQG